jgi:hypothetical protein
LGAIHTTTETNGPRLFSRAEALAILKIGETTLFWLQRTGKLKPIRIGTRVLFNAAQIRRIVARGATLTEAEKEAAAKRDREATTSPKGPKSDPSQKTATSRACAMTKNEAP